MLNGGKTDSQTDTLLMLNKIRCNKSKLYQERMDIIVCDPYKQNGCEPIAVKYVFSHVAGNTDKNESN